MGQKMKKIIKTKIGMLCLMLTVLLTLASCFGVPQNLTDDSLGLSSNSTVSTENGVISNTAPSEIVKAPVLELALVPKYSGEPYTVINDNVPFFEDSEYTTASFELYGELDSFGRCTTVYAGISTDTMPTEERGSIGSVKPSGWQTVKYDNVDGKYLYNRCHLIGWQLTSENANKQNLITGTRYMNVDGMLVFENMTADYIKETGNHVLYRVTPIFDGDDLVASGVLMEAHSVEDNGDGISFCVYCYNVQPGIVINYADGTSKLASDSTEASESTAQESNGEESEYILNTGSKKFHYPTCSSVKDMSESNKQTYTGTREELISDGYSPCGSCKP